MMDFAYNQKTASHAPAFVILTTITGRSGFERDGSFSTSKGTHWQSFDAALPLRRSALLRTHTVSARSSWAFSRRARCAR